MRKLPSRPPFLSVILPTTKNYNHLLIWTLRSYSLQTVDFSKFEIIVVEDGERSAKVESLCSEEWPFACRYFSIDRVLGKEHAHKNHARNLGVRMSRGDVVFICDCDFVVHPEFVDRVIELYSEAYSRDSLFCLYPQIACLNDMLHTNCTEDNWKHTLGRVQSFGSVPHHFDSFYDPINIHTPKLVENENKEGLHVMSRLLLESLGAFDEEFIGWGGNKQEFQHRIVDSGKIKQYLLHGCTVYHQPHERLGDNQKLSGDYNFKLMLKKRSDRTTSKTWQDRVKLLEKTMFSSGVYETKAVKEIAVWFERCQKQHLDKIVQCIIAAGVSKVRWISENSHIDISLGRNEKYQIDHAPIQLERSNLAIIPVSSVGYEKIISYLKSNNANYFYVDKDTNDEVLTREIAKNI